MKTKIEFKPLNRMQKDALVALRIACEGRVGKPVDRHHIRMPNPTARPKRWIPTVATMEELYIRGLVNYHSPDFLCGYWFSITEAGRISSMAL